MLPRRSAFTLIELLVVIAIIAVLAVVVVLTLNPAQLLAQSRDANRVSDMATLNSAIGLYQTDMGGVGNLGSSSVVYGSIFDPAATSSAGTSCGTMGLPILPTSYSYHCAASSTFRNPSQTGWIPLNFQIISAGAPFGSLPVDPTNQSSSRLYYTYTTNGSQYEFTASIESTKYKVGGSNDVITSDGSSLSSVYAKGTNLALEPIDYGDSSLVGYWPMDEGTGSSTIDASGNGNTGTWVGMPTGSYYASGKVGSYAGNFNGSSYLNISDSPTLQLTNAMTISFWVKTAVSTTSYFGLVTKYGPCTGGTCGFDVGGPYAGHAAAFNIRSAPNSWSSDASSPIIIDDGSWHNIVGVFNGTQVVVYGDGRAGARQLWNYPSTPSSAPFQIGARSSGSDFPGFIDDVRIYNRALSAAEIQAIYNATK